VCCSIWPYVAVCCRVLNLACSFGTFGAAMSVLQCVAVSGNMLQCFHLACGLDSFGAGMNVLQCVAVCCRVLRCVVVCCIWRVLLMRLVLL